MSKVNTCTYLNGYCSNTARWSEVDSSGYGQNPTAGLRAEPYVMSV
jgi:hypothetical protein